MGRLSNAARIMAKAGGRVRSRRKTLAVRLNGKKGGRPFTSGKYFAGQGTFSLEQVGSHITLHVNGRHVTDIFRAMKNMIRVRGAR